MSNRVVTLLLRATLANQQRPYLKPVAAANGAIRPLWALCGGKPTYFSSGIYYLRFKQGPKLVFERIGLAPEIPRPPAFCPGPRPVRSSLAMRADGKR